MRVASLVVTTRRRGAQADRDHRRRHRRHHGRQPPAAEIRRATTPTSTSSTETTATSTSRGSCSCRSASRRSRRSSVRAAGSCARAFGSTRKRSTPSPSAARRCGCRTARSFPYHALVVASGARLCPEETPGLTGPGWNERAFTFYTAAGAAALRERLESFEGGRLVVNLMAAPIKCPVGPLEFAFLADWLFHERGMRERVDLAYVTPLSDVFANEAASVPAALAARVQGNRADHGFQLERGRRRGRRAARGGRPPDALRPARHRAAAWRRRVRRTVGASGRCARVRPHEHAHPASRERGEHLRDRRCDRPADLEGRVGDPLRGRGADRQRRALSRGREAGARLRRPLQPVRRDRIQQGAPARLQLRDRAAPGALSARGGPAPAAARVAAEPSRQRAFPWLYWHALLPGHDLPVVGPNMPLRGKRRPLSPRAAASGSRAARR